MKILALNFKFLFFLFLAWHVYHPSERIFNTISVKDKIDTSQKITIDSLLAIWRIDSLGCKGLRDISISKMLVDSFDLNNQNSQKIIRLLGEPNKIVRKEKYFSIRYYYNTLCFEYGSRQILDNESISCWIEFDYNDSMDNKCLILPICH